MQKSSNAPSVEPELPIANPWLTAVAAWALPGLGHVLLGRRGRALVFFVLCLAMFAVGLAIDGRMPWTFSGSPLARLATLGGMGLGVPYLLTHMVFGYEGDVTAPGFEYGGAFIVTAGLMNLLLVLDAWDICWGKELPVAADEEGEDDGEDGDDEPSEDRDA